MPVAVATKLGQKVTLATAGSFAQQKGKGKREASVTAWLIMAAALYAPRDANVRIWAIHLEPGPRNPGGEAGPHRGEHPPLLHSKITAPIPR